LPDKEVKPFFASFFRKISKHYQLPEKVFEEAVFSAKFPMPRLGRGTREGMKSPLAPFLKRGVGGDLKAYF